MRFANLSRATLGCTPYEMARLPRLVSNDDQTTTLLTKAFNFELICPVCLSLLQRPMAVMECMHRFCDECISKSIRLGKKEYPTCRVKCASRRSLRHDAALEEFLSKVFPDRDEWERRNITIPARHRTRSCGARGSSPRCDRRCGPTAPSPRAWQR